MAPATILLLRHAEKPDDKADPGLSEAGQRRAGRMAEWLPAALGRPDFLFAAADKPGSARPRLTLEPLAAATGLAVDAGHSDKDSGRFARMLLAESRFDGARIVVSWRHAALPPLARALGAAPGEYPEPWPEDLYDLMLRLDFAAAGPPRVAGERMP